MSTSIESRLATLEAMIRDEPDLSRVARYFHDELGNDGMVHAGSVPVDHPRFMAAVGLALQNVLGRQGSLVQSVVLRYGGTSFHHGAGFFGGKMVVFFLFDHLGMGLVIAGDDSSHLLRITILGPGEARTVVPGPSVKS